MQDSKGYIWISTSAGVTKYDGKEFKTYTKNNGLTDNSVFSTYEDKKGRIWFRTSSGALCYYLSDSIYPIAANKQLLPLLNKRIVSKLLIDESENLWLSLYGSTDLVEINPKSNYSSIKAIKQDPSKFHLKIFSDASVLFSARKNPDLVNLTFRLNFATYSKEISTPKIVPSIFPHILFIDTSEFILSDGHNSLHHFKNGAYQKIDFDNRLINIFKDKEGAIWVSVYKNGISKHSVTDLAKPLVHVLDGLTVSSFCEDYEGGIWFSTLENGTFYKKNLENKLFQYPNSEMFNSIRFFKKLNNRLFIGTDNPSVVVVDQQFHSSLLDLGKIPTGYIINDITFYKSKYYLASFTNLKVYDSQFKLKNEIKGTDDKFLPKRNINSNLRQVLFVSDSSFYLNDGYSISFAVDLVTQFKIELPTRVTGCVYDSITKTMYVGTKTGLFYIDRSQKLSKIQLEGVEESSVSGFCPYKDKTLLASQQNGVFLLWGKQFKRIFHEDDLLINGICVDDNQTIWLSTNKGIVRLEPASSGYNYSLLSKADGLQSNEINYITCYNHHIWYAASNGIYHFPPEKIIKKSVVPKLEIDFVMINDQKWNVSKDFNLKYNENNIMIKANCLSFLPGGESSLSYRLLGYDSIWKNSRKENVINYTNLPAGQYKFQVKGVNCKNISSLDIKTISFSIRPPFWKTWWFILLEIAGGIIALIITVFFYIKKIRKKESEKNRINQLMAEYQMTALRAQINPHFIFNCLSSIQVLVLKKNVDKAYHYLHQFSKLLRLVLQNSKRNFTSLTEELEVVSLYVELEQLRFENSFEFKKTIADSVDTSTIVVPYMILQPIVENAIWHGLMHSDKVKKEISLVINTDNNKVIIEIKDNGIGRQKSKEYKTETKTSMGGNITAERLSLFNIEKQQKASMEIKDLYDEVKPLGTLVRIIIPQ
jgi:ligand-binding sensor domain-containing protein